MYCGKCGTKLDDITGLCPKCSGLYQLKRKKIWSIVFTVVFTAFFLVACVLAYKKHEDSRIPEDVAGGIEQEVIESVAVEDPNVFETDSDSKDSDKKTDFIKGEQVVWTYLEGTNQTDTSEVLRIAVDGKPLDIKMQGYEQKTCRSLSGNVWCILSGDNTLYAIESETVTKVAENVTDCVLSAGGEVLAYTDERDTLILYSVGTGAKTKIAQNVDKVSGFVVSPDGNSVAYAAPDEKTENSDSLAMYVYSRGKTVKMGINQIPVGISNEAKQIYYVISHDKNLYAPCSLYVGDIQGTGRLLVASEMMLDGFCFNADQTQLFFVSDGNFYLCINGGEAVQLTSNGTPSLYLNLVYPRSSVTSYIKSWNRFGGSVVYIIYPINNFAEHYYTEYPTFRLLYLDKNLELIELGNGHETGFVELSDDANTLQYSLRTDNGCDLYLLNPKERAEPALLATNIRYGRLSSNGDSVYYIDQNDVLWYKKGQKEPKYITDNIDFCNMTYDGYAVFGTFGSTYDENKRGMLYSSKDGCEKQLIISDFLDTLFTYPTVTIAYANYEKESNTHDIYAAVDGVNFVKIVEGAKYQEYY